MLFLTGKHLTLTEYKQVAVEAEKVSIAPESIRGIEKSAATVQKIVESSKTVYGINTGFGALASISISPEKTKELQKNIILSHAAGVGEPLRNEMVRGIMLLRANSLVKGYSGVRRQTIQMILDFLNLGITPIVPEQGSVGASGDLAPLAHIARAMLGEGEVFYQGNRVKALHAIQAEGLTVLQPIQKEGLALLNGTQFISSVLSYSLLKAYQLFEWSLVAACASLDGLKASSTPFDARIQEVRAHKGQSYVASKVREYLMGSEILESHKNCGKVQDAYSLRAIPQVLGSVWDTLEYARNVVEVEMNSATDNPLIFDNEVLSGGNFHGEPVALVSDFSAIAMSELGNISERRIDRLVNPLALPAASTKVSALPAFLAKGEAGLNSGYMLWQYTAAALVSENKTRCFPASVDSIPTSANQEDHVSMGPIAARKFLDIVHNDYKIVAIELMLSLRALHFLKPLTTGTKLFEILKPIQSLLDPHENDRYFGDDFQRIHTYISANMVSLHTPHLDGCTDS